MSRTVDGADVLLVVDVGNIICVQQTLTNARWVASN
jgi:hypothetical protein